MDDQRTAEWLARRLGKVTASCVYQVMTKGGGATRKNYMMQILCERLTGVPGGPDLSRNTAVQRGVELEPMARSAYEIAEGVMTQEVGFIEHPEVQGFGASPDGFVGGDGLLEIKCPNTAQHIETLKNGTIDKKYMWQMQAQMACTGRDWCDFVSFDDRLPEHLQYKCIRVEKDIKQQAEMLTEISRFLSELEALVADLTKLQETA